MFAIQCSAEAVILIHENRRRAEIYLHGAVLNRYEAVLADGTWWNVIHAYETPQQCRQTLTDGFHSAKLSPFACRVRHGKYRFEQQEHQLDGLFQAAGHAAHGLMFHVDFSVVATGADKQSAWLELVADYPFNDSGYPFAYRLNIVYRLDSDGLNIATRVTNTGTTAMPLADGWHPYFHLDGQVDDWSMQLNSSQRLVFDHDLVATGQIQEDVRFQTASALQGIELDNSFVLADDQHPACILESRLLQLRIEPDHSYPYLQIYIPPHRQSIALENLSGAPDCFNNGLGLKILPAGQSQIFHTRYVLRGKV